LIKARYTNSESYVKEKASKENFMTAAKSCALLLIAAHHQLDPDQSQFSITLAPGTASDGVVRLSDLYEVRNSGISLIVLSMCDALGSTAPSSEGERITAELLSVAGIHSVLGGQWQVSDKASSKLMDEFYRALTTPDCSKAEALRRAQCALINSGQFRHPYYWAGFALYGNQN
jgi:CHAT domain-containing protein